MSRTPLALFPAAPGGASRRFVLIAVRLVVTLACGASSRWASTPNYVSLFHDLELNDAGVVDQRLTKAGIPYRLGAGGTEIQVPVAEAGARARRAREGRPAAATAGPGLELFDKPSWGMTDFTQRVTYQRALEGELARTIGGHAGGRARRRSTSRCRPPAPCGSSSGRRAHRWC